MARATMLAALAAVLCARVAHAADTSSSQLACSQSVVVVVPPPLPPSSSSSPSADSPPTPTPRRRPADQPFFAFVDQATTTTTTTGPSSSSSSAADLAALASLINGLAATIEAATGRRLFPVRAELLSANERRRLGCADTGGGSRWPPVSWDPHTGRMVVRLASGATAETMAATSSAVGAVAREAARRLGALAALSPTQHGSGAQAAVAAAVAASLALALPFWECVACVAALGLLVPLAINAALGAAVDAACGVLHLSPDECFDLSLGALLAGVVLAALSAGPIFAACRLAQCGRSAARVAVV